jgi:parvulin-like peptidyl-prolyl isomerase
MIISDASDSKQNKKDLALSLVKKIEQGASFAALAKKYSQGPDATTGGLSAITPIDSLNPSLRPVLLSLPERKVTEPLPLPSGDFLILRVEKRLEPTPLPFEKVHGTLFSQLMEKKISERLNLYLEEARNRHIVEFKP